MKVDLDELERLAKAATPGPWELGVVEGKPEDFAAHNMASVVITHIEADNTGRVIDKWWQVNIPGTETIILSSGCGPTSEANARLASALDPETILSLISQARAADGLRAEVAEARAVLRKCRNSTYGMARGRDDLATDIDAVLGDTK